MHFMQILMYINIRHNTAAERIILQIINHPVHLIHHTFLILVLHAELIAICLSNRTGLIRPFIPHRTIQIMNIIRLPLPNPKHLFCTSLNRGLTQRNGRELLRQIITIDDTKLLNRIGTCPIFPMWTYLLSFCAGAILQNILTHIYKNLICQAHNSPPLILLFNAVTIQNTIPFSKLNVCIL